ncbi:MAG: 50S ribosomal protein L5 [Candidatus Omnitrophota bacterium]|nr:50S ribosomal protein L5 [Candidatus Omnitrophota bacterium]MBU1928750.1 50S ribosomal protein L5 [Candidatus Omnitrophota bacterium]MBU2034205.1 50S ribosomal protein L5 [Candidatus Omnitrophota bacterium]MBU2222176.1 50S ribosomal protein L5 [Candidatus Omnitrophota bacterium]MBU2257969.1 50S ribosomal protein L5 [Candidatus Omnitrophota bacterium]
MIPRLLEKYRNEISPIMMEQFKLKNKYAVPKIEKIVVNMGVGEALGDIKILEKAMDDLALITGQKPIMRRAKKAIANFKIRDGLPIGCKVTLRKTMMYEFMDRLLNVALPRIRDFRGVPERSFDKAGNYTLGLSEQGIFPEIDYDRITRVQGMDVTFVIKNAKTAEEAREFLRLFGMPFSRKNE